MSLDAAVQDSPVVDSVAPLLAWLHAGEKSVSQHRCGLESERVAVVSSTGAPAPLSGPGSLGELVRLLATETGGRLLLENDAPVGIDLGGASVAFEPGGQLELSGAPYVRVADMKKELDDHIDAIRRLGRQLGLTFLNVGYRPFGPREVVPWLPRGRYALMRRRLPGGRAHDMMQMTASVQANFDFVDEGDLGEKVAAATAVSPVIAALFANSPFIDGRPAGTPTARYGIWNDVDVRRSGLLRLMYEPGFTYERYLAWIISVPLLFVRRNGQYLDPEGLCFADMLREGFAGQPATMQDFVDALSTLFPEIRVKRVIEVRGADAVDARMTVAMPALWTALLYDPECRRQARLLLDGSFEQLLEFQSDVARHGLKARYGQATALDLGRQLLQLADDGLRRRYEAGFDDERPYLDPLCEVVASGLSPGDRLLARYEACGHDRAAMIDAMQL